MSHGGAPAGWLESSANLNPLGVPPEVVTAVARASYGRYADLDPAAAEEHLARDAGVPASCVMLTAGATEAIRLVATAFAEGRRTLVLGPTYSEYARCAERARSAVVDLRATAPSFDPPVAGAIERLDGPPCLLFACDPNNPTGRALGAAGTRALTAAVPAASLVVLDQSFAPFAPPSVEATELIGCGRVVLVRSLTKRLAAPGIRVGYVIAAPDLISRLRGLQDPWAVGAHAVAAARAASWELRGADRGAIDAWRARLVRGLEARGAEVVPSAANFVLARVGAGAATLIDALARRRIAVRSCASFGLPDHIRVAVRPPDEQDVLLEEIAAARTATAP